MGKLGGVLVLLVAGLAAAEPVARDKLVVYRSDAGHVLAIEPGSDEHVYFGDKKRVYKQWLKGSGGTVDDGYAYFWEPRLGKHYESSGGRIRHRTGKIVLKDGKAIVECGDRSTTFEPAPDAADKARFLEPLWQREEYWLARDDMGVYYYVDRMNADKGGKGFRVFIGPRGKMKPTRLINVAVDSGGAVFATRKGSLGLVTVEGEEPKTRWIKKKEKLELTTLPIHLNRYLIYAELGVYDGQQLGTPCDFY